MFLWFRTRGNRELKIRNTWKSQSEIDRVQNTVSETRLKIEFRRDEHEQYSTLSDGT